MTQNKPIDKTFQDLKTKIGRAIVERIQEGLLTGVTSKNGLRLLSDNTDAHITAVTLLFKTTLKLNKDGQTGCLVFEKQPIDLPKNPAILRVCTKNQKTSLLDDYERVNTDYLTDFGWQIVDYVPFFVIKKRRFYKDKLLLGTLVPEAQYDSLATSIKQAKDTYSVSQTLPSELASDPKNAVAALLEPQTRLMSLEAKAINLKDLSKALPDIAHKGYLPPDDPKALDQFVDFNKTLVKGYEAEILDLQNKMLKVLETCGRDIVINL
jgi:hypothetical protein